MNKNHADMMKKIKEIMLSYQKELKEKDFIHLQSSIPEFSLIESENTRWLSISSENVYNKRNLVSNEEAFALVDMYLQKGGKPLHVNISGRTRYNTLINTLFKTMPDDTTLDRFCDCFYTVTKATIYNDALVKITKHIKDKKSAIHENYGQKIAFKILSKFGKESPQGRGDSFFYNSTFPYICANLCAFKVKEEDYPVLFNVFNYFQKGISNDSACRNAFINFLRNSIPSKDWAEFKNLLNDEKAKATAPVQTPNSMFEEKTNPKYHLNISEEIVTSRYPSVSLSNDYMNMITYLVSNIIHFKNELNLEHCCIMPSLEKKITSVYFLSKDESPVDEEKIKKLFSSMIEFFAELKESKQTITNDATHLAIKANILAFDLEKNSNKNANKSVTRSNKI